MELNDSAQTLKSLEVFGGSVFHYTSAMGLLGALQHQTLWASEAASLNDVAEIRQGWDFVNKWLDSSDSEGTETLRGASRSFPDAFKEAFVLSASTAPDDANQWRLYADRARGYAIELDGSVPFGVFTDKKPVVPTGAFDLGAMLRDSVQVTGWLRCLYNDLQKIEALRELAAKAASEQKRIGIEATSEEEHSQLWTELQAVLYTDLATIASLIKSDGFSGENEVRVVVSPMTNDTYQQFRPSNVGVVGYVRLGTSVNEIHPARIYRASDVVQPLPVRAIVAGALVRRRGQATLRALLRTTGHDSADVRSSEVPLG